jgi:guanylate kinase
MNKYIIIALVGKAGSGKDTILKGVTKDAPFIHEIISCTTREPRSGEQNGINYYFLNPEQFAEKVLKGEMLEATCFNNWFYGTSYDSLSKSKINIGVFNPAGIEALSHNKDIILFPFYVVASDKQRMIRQLEREENPNVYEIIRRFKADDIDFDGLEQEFSFEDTLYNDNLTELEENIKHIMLLINEIYAMQLGQK